MKTYLFAILLAAIVAFANCATYLIVQPEDHIRVARSPQFPFGGSGASANAAAQSFGGGGFGGFGGSGASANAASQSFGGGGFPGGFSGSSANAGAQSFGFGR